MSFTRKFLKLRWIKRKTQEGGYLEVWQLYAKPIMEEAIATVFLNGDGHEVRTIANYLLYDNGNGIWVSLRDSKRSYEAIKNAEIFKQKKHVEKLVIASLFDESTMVGLCLATKGVGGNSKSRRRYRRLIQRLKKTYENSSSI